MSRNQPLQLPDNIRLETKNGKVTVRSDKAEVVFSLPQSGNLAADAGTKRSLTLGAIAGLTTGFTKTLEIQGTGYRAIAKDKDLELSLGYSHPIKFSPPAGVTLAVKDNRLITITGIDKYLVGQTAAKLRALRPPDAYKGKGIRYLGEVIKLKPGKAAKAAEA